MVLVSCLVQLRLYSPAVRCVNWWQSLPLSPSKLMHLATISEECAFSLACSSQPYALFIPYNIDGYDRTLSKNGTSSTLFTSFFAAGYQLICRTSTLDTFNTLQTHISLISIICFVSWLESI